MSAAAEIELKLSLDPGRIGAVQRLIRQTGAAPREVEVDNIYFDTSDRLLHRNRMALRLRAIEGRWLQTLKTSPTIAGALARRGEWESAARVVRGNPQLDFTRLAGSPLPALLARQRPRRALRPVFRTRFRRMLWLLETELATIEVALDAGEIAPQGATGALVEPICELELELKRGEVDALYDLALRWIGDSSRPVALRPALLSKAERGYRLAAGLRAEPMKAGAGGFAAVIDPTMSTAEALRAVIAHGTVVVLANAEPMGVNEDPEFVHQARVALRRMRSAVRLLDDGRDMPVELLSGLRWLARRLGGARDWDVITGQTLPRLLEGIRGPAATTLTHAEARRQLAVAGAQRAVASARYARLILGLERWSRSRSPASFLLASSAQPHLQRAARRLFRAARAFPELGVDRRHRVRILAKRLRYALDLYSVVLPRPETVRYVDALAHLQDVLGELNDAAVAGAVLPTLTRSKALARAVARRRRALAAKAVPAVEASLAALRKLAAPWHGKQSAGNGAKSA